MLENVKNFFVNNKTWILVLIALAALYGAFFLGKVSVPKDVQIVEKQVVVEKEVVKVVTIEKTIVEKAQQSDLDKHVHKERTEETHADGTKVVKETEDINVDKVVKTTEIQYVDRINTIEKQVEVEKKVEVEKRVEVQKLSDWTVSARFGADITKLTSNLVAPQESLLIGVGVDRRIIGPFKAGVWAQTNTTFNSWQAGIAVSGDF